MGSSRHHDRFLLPPRKTTRLGAKSSSVGTGAEHSSTCIPQQPTVAAQPKRMPGNSSGRALPAMPLQSFVPEAGGTLPALSTASSLLPSPSRNLPSRTAGRNYPEHSPPTGVPSEAEPAAAPAMQATGTCRLPGPSIHILLAPSGVNLDAPAPSLAGAAYVCIMGQHESATHATHASTLKRRPRLAGIPREVTSHDGVCDCESSAAYIACA